MSDQIGNPESKGLTKKVLLLSGFVIGLGAFVGALNTIFTDTKPWVCSLGLSFSWCERPEAPDTWGVEVGGPGGDPFNPITCRPGQALVGLYGKAIGKDIGPFIFSIGPICAAARFNRAHQITSLSIDALSKGDEVGSNQGDPFELKCPSNTVVVGSGLNSAVINTNAGPHDYLVAPLALKCSSILSSADASLTKTIRGAGEHLAFASQMPFSCPDGSVAFGIKGRSGQFIDAISLGCREDK